MNKNEYESCDGTSVESSSTLLPEVFVSRHPYHISMDNCATGNIIYAKTFPCIVVLQLDYARQSFSVDCVSEGALFCGLPVAPRFRMVERSNTTAQIFDSAAEK